MGQSEPDILFFYNDNVDELACDSATYNIWEEGGIYINGELVSAPLIHFSNQEYYIGFRWATGVELKDNDRIMIRGVLSDGTNKIRFHQEKAFIYNNGTWTKES